jgi:hypothetical protein
MSSKSSKAKSIRIVAKNSVQMMSLDAATRAIVLLSRFAARRAQLIAKEQQGAAANTPSTVKSNGYRPRNKEK